MTAARSKDSAEYGLQETARLRFADAPMAPPESLRRVGEAILDPVIEKVMNWLLSISKIRKM